MINEIRDLFDDVDFGPSCHECGAQCCFLPWLPKEELDLVTEFRNIVETIGNVSFFMNRARCKFVNSEGVCEIYALRPLDCRLFPLDIIEQDGRYYWCFYTICPTLSTMKHLLESKIPEIEPRISDALWNQFKKQIEISKEIYEPYKNRQYYIISEVTRAW